MQIIKNIRAIAEPVINDRPMDSDIENIANAIRENKIYDLQ